MPGVYKQAAAGSECRSQLSCLEPTLLEQSDRIKHATVNGDVAVRTVTDTGSSLPNHVNLL